MSFTESNITMLNLKSTIRVISAIILLAVLGCSKDADVHPKNNKVQYLSNISKDGAPFVDFYYDSEKRLSRLDYHVNGSLFLYILFDYNSEGLKEFRSYGANHNMNFRTLITLDNMGRIIKANRYLPANPNEIANVSTYAWNESGQYLFKDFKPFGFSVVSQENFRYNDQRMLVEQENILNPGPHQYISGRSEIVPGSTTVPAHWISILGILKVSGNFDFDVWEMFAKSLNYKSWDDKGNLLIDNFFEYTGQEFDSDGYLI